jgi:hypothetical protein
VRAGLMVRLAVVDVAVAAVALAVGLDQVVFDLVRPGDFAAASRSLPGHSKMHGFVPAPFGKLARISQKPYCCLMFCPTPPDTSPSAVITSRPSRTATWAGSR